MTTSSPPTRPPRRPPSVSNSATASRSPPTGGTTASPNPSGTTLVAKGSISRTSPGPKATPPVRRATASSSRPSSSLSNPREGGTKDATPSKLKENGVTALVDGGINASALDGGVAQGNHEELLVRIQDLDNTVSTLATDNANLQTSLTQAETRMTELYADQARTEEELGMRHEVAEKLRTQLREFEKEKRDLTRRYNEQTAAFEAERVSFYDNEQHLKSRIQALTQSRKEHKEHLMLPRKPRHSAVDDAASIVSEAEYPPVAGPPEGEMSGPARTRADTIRPNRLGESKDVTSSQEESDDDDDEPAEMTGLKLELSTLSTSHASLQSTLHLLQSQLLDLQRVNAELQEENEGWKVLIQQRTLAGTFDILTLGGANNEDATVTNSVDDTSSMKSGARSALDKVSEMDEIAYEVEMQGKDLSIDSTIDPALRVTDGLPPHIGRSLDSELNASQRDSSPASRRSRRKGTLGADEGDGPKGETLADLPITGPGLDLAAELGRAQNAEGFIEDSTGTSGKAPKKVLTAAETQAKNEMESLKVEVKNLKDANKALSLYASKIIDRIIATEGFEDVLAVDFQDKQATKKTPTKPRSARPGSLMFGMSETTLGSAPPRTMPPKEKLTTFESIGLSNPATATTAGQSNRSNAGPPPTTPKKQPAPADDPRRSRRSMSFDWRGFSLFGGGQAEPEKKPSDSFRPLQLRPGAATGVARKLETTEDEEDRIERERLRATMRLMGIDASSNQQQQAAAAAATQLRPLNVGSGMSGNSTGGFGGGQTPPSPKTAVATTSNRWSLFGGRKNDAASTSSSSLNNNDNYMSPPPAPTSLTTEALKQAEAESHIAALDAREKLVKEEIAKGGASGFTELSGLSGVGPRKRIGEEWRNRRSSSSFAGGSGMGLSRSRSLRNSQEASEAGSASTVWSAGKDDD